MTKINPYHVVKQAGISPGAATLLALGAGGGLGYLWDTIDRSKGNPPESSWRRPLLGAALAGLPFWIYGLGRSSLSLDENGKHTVPILKRWFTDDDTYFNYKPVKENIKRYLEGKRLFYSQTPTDKPSEPKQEEYAVADNGSSKTAEWASNMGAIPVNAFNQTTWVDASRGRTPMEAAGYVTNTLSQTGRRVGSNFVTPGQVINTMVNAGIGYGTAWLAGKTLGALAGVKPETQKKLCEIGTWGGMLGGISNAANSY